MNLLFKCIGITCIILLQSCSSTSSPFSGGSSGDPRIGSGTGAGFVEGAVELASSSITEGASTLVSVNIVDSDGALITEIGTVTFSSTCVSQSQASLSQATVDLTAGTASSTYTDISCSGTDNITAVATLESGLQLNASSTLTITPVTKIGSGTGAGFQEGVITFGATSIVPGGNTSVLVNIVDANNALSNATTTIAFSSTCTSASFTNPSVTTNSGTAQTTYVDNGCSGTDFITATLTIGSTNIVATGQLSILPLRIGTGTGAGFVEGAVAIATTPISEGGTTDVSVNIVDAAGALFTSPVTVNFDSTCTPTTASFSQGAVTTSSGTATSNYRDAGCIAADTITLTLDTVSTIDPTATGTLNLSPLRIGSGSGAGFTNGVVTLGLASISAGGTTSVSVNVVDAQDALVSTPITVTFDSNCVSQGFSSFDNTTASTVNGLASITYTAGANCTGSDTITATIDPFGNNQRTAQANVTIAAAAPGSIQFTSTGQDIIALQGSGNSTGLSESTTLTFTVLDTTGQPFSNVNVTFTLNTTLGGITLTPTNDTSDANGLVQTIISSGTVAGSVRVTATIDSNGLSTQSTAIVISTGLPHQNSFSLSASELNPRAWDLDGVNVTITALLADRFNNPIQDGTNISFTTELGSIVSSCTTVNGGCSTTWRSQAPRDASGPGTNAGRTTILANVVGEESFLDVDGNGIYSDGDGNNFSDLPEAFVDWDEDNNRDNGGAAPFDGTPEPFKDFNVNGAYDGPDGQFNGVSCTHSTNCSSTQTTFVRSSIVLVMAEDNPAVVQITSGGATVCDSTVTPTPPSPCSGTGNTYPTGIDVSTGSITIGFTFVGNTNYQVLPMGTTIVFKATNGKIVSGGSQTVLNTNANTYSVGGAPTNLNVATYSVTIGPDTTSSADGNLTIQVTTPGGLATDFPPIPIAD